MQRDRFRFEFVDKLVEFGRINARPKFPGARLRDKWLWSGDCECAEGQPAAHSGVQHCQWKERAARHSGEASEHICLAAAWILASIDRCG